MTDLTIDEYIQGFLKAAKSKKKRHCEILHEQGAVLNKNYNFLLKDTYMQPHSHIGVGRDEFISCLLGELEIVEFYDVQGNVKERIPLFSGDSFVVPAGSIHTYFVKSDFALTYEEMSGVYDPKTWKRMAEFAPTEDSDIDAVVSYVEKIKR